MFSQQEQGKGSFVLPGGLSLLGLAAACKLLGFVSWRGGYSVKPWCWALDRIIQQ